MDRGGEGGVGRTFWHNFSISCCGRSFKEEQSIYFMFGSIIIIFLGEGK